MRQLMVVEDDAEVAEGIRAELEAGGYQVLVVHDGAEALARGLAQRFDLITLDRMLPSLDGLQVVDGLRQAGVRTPVLMVSALNAVDERIRGLRAGGDDYLVKPFDLGELAARVEVLLRRHGPEAQALSLRIGDLELDLVSRKASRAGQAIALQNKEFLLLEYLMRNSGQVLTKRMILEAVWNLHFDPSTNLIEVHMARLRKKIDPPELPPLIQTLRGSGYTLKASA